MTADARPQTLEKAKRSREAWLRWTGPVHHPLSAPGGRAYKAEVLMHFHDEAEHDDVPFRFEGAPGRGHQIVVTAGKRKWLAARWEHQWRRPPTGEELGRLVEDFVREEVLYREALTLGLDLADLVVRRRLVQKMEVLAFADCPSLGDAGVMDYFLAHREAYRLPERISFAHVYFSAAARGDQAAGDARAARAGLRHAGAADAAGVGDPPVAASPVIAATRRQVTDRFGAEFADAVFAFDSGPWAGPVASAYGQHLVLVTEHAPGRLPDLAEVSGRVAADMDAERRAGALDALYARLRAQYEVVDDGGAGPEGHTEHQEHTAAIPARA
jgi:parvulin-like peptidyl-prolyl cis-trans isomerase-like protein